MVFDIDNLSVCVIGVGYVGEHLVDLFSSNGTNVIGIDISPKRAAFLQEKHKNNDNVSIRTTYSDLQNVDAFIVAVPTMVSPDGECDLRPLDAVKNELWHLARPGSLIVVESSVYVGATRQIFGSFLENGVHVGFSPERVDPGRSTPTVQEVPKIISGLNEGSLQQLRTLYSSVFSTVVPVSSCECAEMCKLYENCFRMVNIAYVNEISDMCKTIGIDTQEMIRAASTKPYGFMPFFPGTGVGGHCIPVNPHYLFHNGNLPVLEYSTRLMADRPQKLAHELVVSYPEAQNLLMVGIGFKKGEALLTNSPGYQMYLSLVGLGKNVTVYDPIVQKAGTAGSVKFLDVLDVQECMKFDKIVVTMAYNPNNVLDDHNVAQKVIRF